MPGSTGRTHDAVSTRAPVSTTQSRHTPTGVSFCKWQSVGIGVPFIRAASNTLVPAATARSPVNRDLHKSRRCRRRSHNLVSLPCLLCALCELCVKSLPLDSRSNPHALRFSRPRRSRKTNPARALVLSKRARPLPPENVSAPTDTGAGTICPSPQIEVRLMAWHKLLDQRQVRPILFFRQSAVRPSHQQVRHLLRTHTARHALSARFIAIKTHRVQRHVQHAGRIVANHNRARTQHRPRIGQRLEIQPHIHHRRRQIP